jgi:branched-chain amino acid transport system ATP-binding protein
VQHPDSMAMRDEALLSVRNLVVGYGPSDVVHGVTLSIRSAEVVALIGANGAGKTTILSALMGLLPTRAGEIRFAGHAIQSIKPDRRVARGMVLVPEGRQIVPQMSVSENLRIGAYLRRDAEIDADQDRIYAMFPRLKERAKQKGGLLSGGEQQMLAIGRALMSRPRLLLLDEPSMGLAPIIIAQIFDILADIKASGTTVLLVEQNAHQALQLADRAYVLEQGRISASGTGPEIAADPSILHAYLGAPSQRSRYVDQGGPQPLQ